jgi:hypothetical protein
MLGIRAGWGYSASFEKEVTTGESLLRRREKTFVTSLHVRDNFTARFWLLQVPVQVPVQVLEWARV